MDAPNPDDARVHRTRRRVLPIARELLADVGPAELTYSLLSERSGVTRQTLYRHWPTQSALYADLVLAGPEVGYPSPHADPAVVVTDFLASLRAGMNDPTTAAALTALAAHADHDDVSADALRDIAVDRCAALNTLLANTNRQVSAEEFALLVGPVFFQRFFARRPVSDELIDHSVRSWPERLG